MTELSKPPALPELQVVALKRVLYGLLQLEPEACACGNRGCTETREAWTAAREALGDWKPSEDQW